MKEKKKLNDNDHDNDNDKDDDDDDGKKICKGSLSQIAHNLSQIY